MSDMPGFFWIGELAALAGVSPRAIRHDHRVGVLPEPARSPSGYRLYDCDDVDRLLALRALADVGVSLKDAAHSGRDTKDRLQVALNKAMVERAAIEVRISKLEAMLAHEHEFAAVYDQAVTAMEDAAARIGLPESLVRAERRALDLVRRRDGDGRVLAALTSAYETAARLGRVPPPAQWPHELRVLVRTAKLGPAFEVWLRFLGVSPADRTRIRQVVLDARNGTP